MKLKTGNSSRCNKSVQCIEVRAVFREARPPARTVSDKAFVTQLLWCYRAESTK